MRDQGIVDRLVAQTVLQPGVATVLGRLFGSDGGGPAFRWVHWHGLAPSQRSAAGPTTAPPSSAAGAFWRRPGRRVRAARSAGRGGDVPNGGAPLVNGGVSLGGSDGGGSGWRQAVHEGGGEGGMLAEQPRAPWGWRWLSGLLGARGQRRAAYVGAAAAGSGEDEGDGAGGGASAAGRSTANAGGLSTGGLRRRMVRTRSSSATGEHGRLGPQHTEPLPTTGAVAQEHGDGGGGGEDGERDGGDGPELEANSSGEGGGSRRRLSPVFLRTMVYRGSGTNLLRRSSVCAPEPVSGPQPVAIPHGCSESGEAADGEDVLAAAVGRESGGAVGALQLQAGERRGTSTVLPSHDGLAAVGAGNGAVQAAGVASASGGKSSKAALPPLVSGACTFAEAKAALEGYGASGSGDVRIGLGGGMVVVGYLSRATGTLRLNPRDGSPVFPGDLMVLMVSENFRGLPVAGTAGASRKPTVAPLRGAKAAAIKGSPGISVGSAGNLWKLGARHPAGRGGVVNSSSGDDFQEDRQGEQSVGGPLLPASAGGTGGGAAARRLGRVGRNSDVESLLQGVPVGGSSAAGALTYSVLSDARMAQGDSTAEGLRGHEADGWDRQSGGGIGDGRRAGAVEANGQKEQMDRCESGEAPLTAWHSEPLGDAARALESPTGPTTARAAGGVSGDGGPGAVSRGLGDSYATKAENNSRAAEAQVPDCTTLVAPQYGTGPQLQQQASRQKPAPAPRPLATSARAAGTSLPPAPPQHIIVISRTAEAVSEVVSGLQEFAPSGSTISLLTHGSPPSPERPPPRAPPHSLGGAADVHSLASQLPGTSLQPSPTRCADALPRPTSMPADGTAPVPSLTIAMASNGSHSHCGAPLAFDLPAAAAATAAAVASSTTRVMHHGSSQWPVCEEDLIAAGLKSATSVLVARDRGMGAAEADAAALSTVLQLHHTLTDPTRSPLRASNARSRSPFHYQHSQGQHNGSGHAGGMRAQHARAGGESGADFSSADASGVDEAGVGAAGQARVVRGTAFVGAFAAAAMAASAAEAEGAGPPAVCVDALAATAHEAADGTRLTIDDQPRIAGEDDWPVDAAPPPLHVVVCLYGTRVRATLREFFSSGLCAQVRGTTRSEAHTPQALPCTVTMLLIQWSATEHCNRYLLSTNATLIVATELLTLSCRTMPPRSPPPSRWRPWCRRSTARC